MKVKIGKYNTRLTVSSLEHWYFKENFNVLTKEYTKIDKFIEKLCDTLQNILDITINKWYFDKKPNQKVKIKIHNYDTWNADYTLAYIILPLLKKLKKEKHGAPLVDNEDVPKELQRVECEIDDDNWFKRWDYVLDEMIWTFENYNTDWDFYNINFNEKKYKAHQERLTNGLRLFGKYYSSLWD